jgi:hypothetical protein
VGETLFILKRQTRSQGAQIGPTPANGRVYMPGTRPNWLTERSGASVTCFVTVVAALTRWVNRVCALLA